MYDLGPEMSLYDVGYLVTPCGYNGLHRVFWTDR